MYASEGSLTIYARPRRAGESMAGLTVLGKLAVLGGTTLAGGKFRLTVLHQSCSQTHTLFQECEGIDARVTPLHLFAPWVLTVAWLLFLSLPTVLLESRHPEKGMQTLVSVLIHQTLLMLFAKSLPNGLDYALTLHTCVHTLLSLRWDQSLVGGRAWWGLRFPAAAGLVWLAAYYGPPVSVVRWPGADSSDAIACAAQAHLLGALLPDLFLVCEGLLFSVGACLLEARD